MSRRSQIRGALLLGPAAVLLAGLVLSTPAAGDTTPGRVVAGPVLSGDGAAWVEARRGGRLAVRSARAREAPRTVADLVPPRRPRRPRVELDVAGFVGSAAGTALAVRQVEVTARECCRYPAAQLLTGPPGGRLRESARCQPGTSGHIPPVVVEAGDDAAIQVINCEELRRIQLRSFDGEPLAAPPSGDAVLIDAAGPYLAWSAAAGEVTVYDRARGVIAYTARGDGLGELGAVGLAPDGRLAAAYRVAAASRQRYARAWGLAVFAADRPPRPVGALRFPQPARVRLAGERVALSSQDPVGATLSLVDLGREQAQPVARLLRPAEFDLQGDRLTWLDPTCGGPRIRHVDAGAVRAVPSTAGCKVPLARRPVLDGRTLKVTIRCEVFGTATCADYVVVATTRAPSRVVDEAETLPATATRATARLRLSRSAARAFRAGRVKLRVTATASEPSGVLEERRSTLSRSRVTVRR